MNKLAIVGYGKMGRMIDSLAPQYDFEVLARIDIGGDFDQTAGSDVAIEFSAPDAVVGNVEKLAAMRLPIVTGTTGWLKEMEQVRGLIEKYDSVLVWSPNFSIGVNVFSRLVREAAGSPPRYARAAPRGPRLRVRSPPSASQRPRRSPRPALE